jgi:hypothetical protein
MKKQCDTNPIDFVIIWVDGADEVWRAEKRQYLSEHAYEDDNEVRYRDWENLQYWFRAVEKYTPWVRTIHFVTWGHLPVWMNTENPKLHIVNHKDFIPEEYLPTFNSHTIELNLHRIEGLAEQFVYFNDDMFINQKMNPEDFFKNGLPRDIFALDCIYFGKNSAGPYNSNDMAVINMHFPMKKMLKENYRKWFCLRYGLKCLYRTIVLLPWPWFPGFFYQHLPGSYLKSTFQDVWDKEGEILDTTCRCKFRSATNVNQWLMKYWQLASGKFYPRKKKIGRCYHMKGNNISEMLSSIRTGKDGMICVNDTVETTHFAEKKKLIQQAFESRLKEKSSFEI